MLLKRKEVYDAAAAARQDFKIALYNKKLAEQNFNYAHPDYIHIAIGELEIAEKKLTLARERVILIERGIG